MRAKYLDDPAIHSAPSPAPSPAPEDQREFAAALARLDEYFCVRAEGLRRYEEAEAAKHAIFESELVDLARSLEVKE